jgi:hypothetical protein
LRRLLGAMGDGAREGCEPRSALAGSERVNDPQGTTAKERQAAVGCVRGTKRPQNVCGSVDFSVEGGAPLDDPDDDPYDFAKKERLRHGRGLQVKQIGIESEERERESGGGDGNEVASEPIETGARSDPGKCGGNDAGKSGGPPIEVLNERDEEDVRQRQPHRTELRETGSTRIEDAASDMQVGDRVAVVEHCCVTPAPNNGDRRDRRAEGQDGPTFCVGDVVLSQGA